MREFLNILPHHGHYDAEAPFEFHVNDTFSVPFVGTVVSGIVKSGVIHAGDTILIGPDSLGQFTTTTIRSIERKRIAVPAASAGQSASFALKRVRRKDVRKGMVVLPKLEQNAPKVYREFVAEGSTRPFPVSSLYTEFSQSLSSLMQQLLRPNTKPCFTLALSLRPAPSSILTDPIFELAIVPRLPSASCSDQSILLQEIDCSSEKDAQKDSELSKVWDMTRLNR